MTRNRADPGNVVTQVQTVQVEKRKVLPRWLQEAIDAAERGSGSGKVPVLVLTERMQGGKTRRLMVVDMDRLLATGQEEPKKPRIARGR
jgi:hypothetical protein